MSLIYVAEDDADIREIETYALKNQGFDVVSFDTGAKFLRQTECRCPDLAVLDVVLPDTDGIRLIGTVRNKRNIEKFPILLVSAKSTELDIVRGLEAGADDYLVKPFGVMELASRVKALLRRTAEKTAAKADDWVLLPDGETLQIRDGTIGLTKKEYELVQFLLKKKGSVASRDDLMEAIWGTDFLGESRTLDMHIRALRKKLGPAGRRIVTVRGVGYRLEEQAPKSKKSGMMNL